MEQAPERRRVFLSYRSTDRAVVGEFAARLRRDGVDAWDDHGEIAPGDDIVAKMDQGIHGCTAGLIFVSRAWFDGSWVQDEYTSLALRKVEDGIRLIPVLLEDVGDRLPARLRKLARRSVADYEAIRDTLLGYDGGFMFTAREQPDRQNLQELSAAYAHHARLPASLAFGS